MIELGQLVSTREGTSGHVARLADVDYGDDWVDDVRPAALLTDGTAAGWYPVEELSAL